MLADVLARIRLATQFITFSDEIAAIYLDMAPYFGNPSKERFFSAENRPFEFLVVENQDERHHKNVHQLKFKMKDGAQRKTTHDKGGAQTQYNSAF